MIESGETGEHASFRGKAGETNLRWILGTFAAAAAIAIIVALNSSIAIGADGNAQNGARVWALTATLIAVFIALVGYGLNGRPAGVFIDNRNRVSLSKFQATLWTILVISALTTIGAVRLHYAPATSALDIVIPGELLVAMGISAASLVSTPILLSAKMAESPSPGMQDEVAGKLEMPTSEVKTAGNVFGRATPEGARWLDMVRGDELSNAGAPDLGKVQQLLVTLVLVGVYAASIWSTLANTPVKELTTLPTLGERFVWLMGISHASYLAYKVAPHGSAGSAGVAGTTEAVG